MENVQVPQPAFASGQTPNQLQMQYAARKRRRPQPKNKEKKKGQEVAASNPSKRHRDRLNTELDNLSKLIPLPEDTVNKLDKLSILRLAVSYLRNKAFHRAESAESTEFQRQTTPHNALTSTSTDTSSPIVDLEAITNSAESESSLLLKAMNGFIIVVTEEFNIFYISDNVQDYLGFPQSDLMNMSMMELIHAEDRHILMKNISIDNTVSADSPNSQQQHAPPSYTKFDIDPNLFQNLSDNGMMYRSFICRFRCLLDNSSGFLTLHCTGHLRLLRGQNRQSKGSLISPEIGLALMASPLQSPSILEIRTKSYVFRTKHKLDYTPLCIDSKGSKVLGYSEAKLRLRSGYEFIHSADMMHCADAHTKLMTKGESGSTVFRLLHLTNRWVWVFASARLVFRNGRPDYIISTHRPLPDSEGQEYLEKRNAAFRFDFVGQGILYNDINPIGAAGGPENNPLPKNNGSSGGNDPFSENNPPVSKKLKIENAVGGFDDRLSIKGVMSMQRSDIYVNNPAIENIENVDTTDFLNLVQQPLMVKMEPPNQTAATSLVQQQQAPYMKSPQQQGLVMDQGASGVNYNSPQSRGGGGNHTMTQHPRYSQQQVPMQHHQMSSNGNSQHHVASPSHVMNYNQQQQVSPVSNNQQQSANLKRTYDAMNTDQLPYGLFNRNVATVNTLKHENVNFGSTTSPPMYPVRTTVASQQKNSVSTNSPMSDFPMSVSPADGSSLPLSPNDAGYSSGSMENMSQYNISPLHGGSMPQNHPMSKQSIYAKQSAHHNHNYHPHTRGKNMQQQQPSNTTQQLPPHQSRFSRGSGSVSGGKLRQQQQAMSQSPGKGMEIMPALSPDLESLEILEFANSTIEIDLDRIAVDNQTLDPMSVIKNHPSSSLGYLTENYFSSGGNQGNPSQNTNQIPFQHSSIQAQHAANNNSPPLFLPSKGKDGHLSSDNIDSSSDIYLSDT